MNLKKGLLILLLVLMVLITSGTVWLFNADKFYSEYWLQKRVDKLQANDFQHDTSIRTIKYRFYYDPTIDISIEINEKGQLTVLRDCWFNDSQKIKSYHLQVDSSSFKRLKSKFQRTWTESKTLDADFKLGGIYYTLVLNDNGQETSIDYYNVTPDKEFNEFRNELIKLTKKELDK
ncbi:MAG: hypothetical protein QY309_13060 [Cyclobacteriaceae bacterium]|nr:MAG: hypothetical protein QY309_13060 [Cyclobacteriaceae bacterium]